jgi:predicted phage-related endonuclease
MVCVPALLGGRGRVLYVVRPNADLQAIILERCMEFWERCVLTDTPPDGLPTLDVARAMRRREGKRVAVQQDVVSKWRDMDAAAKRAQDEADEAKAAVLAAIGDAEIGEAETGLVHVKSMPTKRIDADKLRKEFPDAAKACEKESTSVRITFKAAKKQQEEGGGK